jgi:starvation-inducible DNA-binding protein
MKNLISIDKNKLETLTNQLNDLLANYQLFYQNLRGYHWNVKGKNFFSLHEKFEELYTETAMSIDEIAERILTLGATPLHSYSDYIEKAEINEAKNVSEDTETVRGTLENLNVLVMKGREVISMADEAGDEGTADMLTGFVKGHEKNIWMLSAFLG